MKTELPEPNPASSAPGGERIANHPGEGSAAEPQSAESHAAPPVFHQIRKRFVKSAFSGVVQLLGSQVLRLAGNLILTRLLVPEVFGLMAIINIALMGVALLSDLGVGASIIQRREHPSLTFLRTAWTIQTIRALLLWIITAAVAYPLSRFYGEPTLLWLLPVVATTQIISGFESTAVHLCQRELRHGIIAKLELSTAFLGTVISVAIAFFHPSVWALVIGGMLSALYRTTMSYFLPGQIRHRFHFNRDAARELIHFGKWLLVASAFSFLASEGDRIILGKVLTLSQLGIYTVAFFFSQAVAQLIRGVAQRTLFPILSRLRDEDSEVQRHEFFRYHRIFLAASFLPITVFLLAGPLIIEFFYDDRYLAAGTLLQILSIGAAGATMRAMAGPVVLSRGNSFARMILTFAEAISVFVCMLVGGSLWGVYGFTGGFVVAQFVSYLPGIYFMRRYKVWNPLADLTYLLLIATVTAAGLWLWWDRLGEGFSL